MTGTGHSVPPAGGDATGPEAAMDAELAELRSEAPGDGAHVRNPVFRHEQAAGSAVAAGEATVTAARVTGAVAAEADQERLLIERQVAAVEASAPASPQEADAEAAEASAEHDADAAVSASLDADAAAEDARRAEGSRYLHRGADGEAGHQDETRALADEREAATDLTALDALEQRVVADGAAPPPAS